MVLKWYPRDDLAIIVLTSRGLVEEHRSPCLQMTKRRKDDIHEFHKNNRHRSYPCRGIRLLRRRGRHKAVFGQARRQHPAETTDACVDDTAEPTATAANVTTAAANVTTATTNARASRAPGERGGHPAAAASP